MIISQATQFGIPEVLYPPKNTSVGYLISRKVTTKPDCQMTTIRTAQRRLHLITPMEIRIERKRTLLPSCVEIGHQLPLKYFTYNNKKKPIKKIGQGGGIKATRLSQAYTPNELTKIPRMTALLQMGIFCQIIGLSLDELISGSFQSWDYWQEISLCS
jgi:hypothetical protein